MPFGPGTFDAVIFVASLQFIEDWRRALAEAARVVQPEGRLIAMLLNPQSSFFKSRRSDPNSYFNRIRHSHPSPIVEEAAALFDVRTEYFLGVIGTRLFDSADPSHASLLVVCGTRKAPGRWSQ